MMSRATVSGKKSQERGMVVNTQTPHDKSDIKNIGTHHISHDQANIAFPADKL